MVFDIGGTSIKFALLSGENYLTRAGSVKTISRKDHRVIDDVLAIAKRYQLDYDISGIGISTAGIVNQEGTIIYTSETMPYYRGTALKTTIEDEIHVPTSVINDVNAALLGELHFGAARGFDNAYCVALGTGIGGAFFDGRQLYQGVHGKANAIGYWPLSRTHSFEELASTLSLERKAHELGYSVEQTFDNAKKGDQKALGLLAEWADKVSNGLASIILILDPGVLVIGGAVAQQGKFLKELVEDALERALPEDYLETQIQISTLANKAQLLGAGVALELQ